jgi:predicted amidohydrolase
MPLVARRPRPRGPRPEANVVRAAELADVAASAGAQLIALPE